MADKKIEQRLVRCCVNNGLTLALAESCTGGLISHRVTNVPGASAVFRGGIVAYANEAKTSLLRVDASLLAAHGAVSEAVALAMAEGARAVLNASVACAVTGIAGPGGGTPEKPVGTVWLAACNGNRAITRHCHFKGTRHAVKLQTAEAAIALLLELMELS